MASGAIGIVHRTIGYPIFWQSLHRLQKPAGQCFIISNEGTSLHRQRNEVVKQALERDVDWLLFCDDDHVTPPDFLMRLLAWDVPFVGGLYFTRTPPHHTTCLIEQPVALTPEDRFRSLDRAEFSGDGLKPVDVLGMGFTLIRREVLDAVGDPWFEMGTFGTDDIAFCLKARDLGFVPQVDCSMSVPHMGIKAVVWNGDHLEICDPGKSVEIAEAFRGTAARVEAVA